MKWAVRLELLFMVSSCAVVDVAYAGQGAAIPSKPEQTP